MLYTMKINRIAILLVLGLVNIMKVSIIIVSINAKSFPGLYALHNVRCPLLHIKTNSTLQCWCGIASNKLNKSRLNWKLSD